MERKYGSCLATEQFVDIKLGSKYFLTLTSFLQISMILEVRENFLFWGIVLSYDYK